MPLQKKFRFSGTPPVQAEAERRARLMFGPDWRAACFYTKTPEGRAAIEAAGRVLTVSFTEIFSRINSKLHDLEDGSPATIYYDQSGLVKGIAHYHDGKNCDPANGTPAQIYYKEDGAVSGGFSSVTGVLSAAKTSDMLQVAQVRRVAALLANADQSVAPAGMPLPENYANPAGNTKSKSGRCAQI